MYSRLARQNERKTRQQSIFLLVVSIIALVLFVIYGFPAILNLTGSIGNLRGKKITAVLEKGVAPATPRFSQDFEATKSAQTTIHGVVDSKISVEIFQNERSLGTAIAKDDGSFSMDVDLARGENIFTAQAISETGQKSPKSDPYRISYLAIPPKLEISSPKDGDNLKDNQVIVVGKSDPNTTVTVNDHLVVVSTDGNFSYSLNLPNGDNKIKVTASDRAGNQTGKELKVSIATP